MVGGPRNQPLLRVASGPPTLYPSPRFFTSRKLTTIHSNPLSGKFHHNPGILHISCNHSISSVAALTCQFFQILFLKKIPVCMSERKLFLFQFFLLLQD